MKTTRQAEFLKTSVLLSIRPVWCEKYEYNCFRAGQTQRCGETLTSPPQSWCYVEELS